MAKQIPETELASAHRVFCITELRNLILDFATPASDYVFKDLKLFTQILSHIPPLELLRSCIYVSKQWHTQLTASRLLFLHPCPCAFEKPKIAYDPNDPYGPIENPNDPAPTDFSINPFFEYAFPRFLDSPKAPRTRSFGDKLTARDFSRLPWLTNPDAWRRKEASWRRMQITQPPTVWLQFHALWPDFRIFDGLENLASSDGGEASVRGFTVGQLYDYLDQVVLNGDELDGRRDWPECSLWLHRKSWEDGDCGISFDLEFFGNVGEHEGPSGEQKALLRSEAYEEWYVDMSEEILPDVD